MARHNKKHGMYDTPTYKSWQMMRQRCCNPNDPSYERYGGRGIVVDPDWADFSHFLRDMGERPEGMSIDRIDNNGPYTKDNCRWASTTEQTRNRSDTNIITYNGLTMCFKDWCKVLGISRRTMYNRLNRGWSLERAFTTPVRKRYG